MALRTKEQLQLLFLERKRINEKRRERERKRYKKASEAVKKALAKKHKQQTPTQPQSPFKCSLSITIYGSHLIKRETAEDDLYQTREELMEAEDRFEGEINWELWEQLIKKYREWEERTFKQSTNTPSKQKTIGDATMKKENI